MVQIIYHLGLQNQRALAYQTYAQMWTRAPPEKGKRYFVRRYPTKDSGKGMKGDEISHMTQGEHALDSRRIFCRDLLRGVAKCWNGEGVVPEDRELRAYLRRMWLKEGLEWDPFTGEKEVASQELMRAAINRNIVRDEEGGMGFVEE
ncbi:hypothetical protein BJ878DRAFT_532017 [Calycina marina]|uniref:Uncharacterized protein n=1 Tax=Calycina marina TaxID=1763456 RepID=A0A9P7ZAM8_9HELO|nr:hypothetical protein BJ878DRAFT_532017 [Calycina marina]